MHCRHCFWGLEAKFWFCLILVWSPWWIARLIDLLAPQAAPQVKMIVTKSGLFEWESEITQLLEIHKTSTKNGLSTQNESQFQLLFARWRAKRCIVNFSLEIFLSVETRSQFFGTSHHQIFNLVIQDTGKSESIFFTLSFYANLSTNPCIFHQNLAF